MFVCGWLCSSLWWGEKASRLDPCASIHTCERSSGSWDSNKRTCARGLFGYSWVSDANEWNSGCRLMSTWSSTSRPATLYLASSTRFVLETVLTADQYKDVQGLKQHKNIPSLKGAFFVWFWFCPDYCVADWFSWYIWMRKISLREKIHRISLCRIWISVGLC